MEIRIISVDRVSVPEALALLDIARGVSIHRPDWQKLKRELQRFDLCGIYDERQLVGFAQVNDHSPYFGGSVQIMGLRYLWQYHQENQVAEMVRGVARLYRGRAAWMVMDVDTKRDFNCPVYKNLGFQTSAMRSPFGRQNVVLLCSMESLS